jgi:hypothetical protein
VDPDAWPKSPEAAAALVALVLADLLTRSATDCDALLEQFERVAWPSSRAQRQ